MKIAVVGANGKAGQWIVNEALERGVEVTAVMRREQPSLAQHVLIKDLFALTRADLAGFDVVIDAFGTWAPESLSTHTTSLMHLCDCLSGTSTRLLVVGGAGSLYLDEEHSLQLMDAPDFPESYKPIAQAMGNALTALRQRDDVDWTYVSPAADFQADGKRTGQYQLCGERFTLNAQGQSVISYADYAIAMLDEALHGNHRHERISVLSK